MIDAMKHKEDDLVEENQELGRKISAAPSLSDHSSTQNELKSLQQKHDNALEELSSLKLLVLEKEDGFQLAIKVIKRYFD